MRFTTREILGIFLVLLTGLSSFGAWREFFITASGDVDILRTLLWFSLAAALFFVGAVVWTNTLFQWLGATLLFLPGLMFVSSWMHLLFSLIAILFAFMAARFIQGETDERLHFHFFRSARAGQFALVFGLSLTLSSSFFYLMKDASWERLAPRFQLGGHFSTFVVKGTAYLYPEVRSALNEGTTVDRFLSNIRSDQGALAEQGEAMKKTDTDFFALPSVVEYLKKNGYDETLLRSDETAETLFLASGRNQLSTLVGRPVSGDERIADVFSLAVERRIAALLHDGKSLERLPSAALPFILSILLFLTLLPLGSLLGPLWILFAAGLFSLAVMCRILRIVRRQKEQETLES